MEYKKRKPIIYAISGRVLDFIIKFNGFHAFRSFNVAIVGTSFYFGYLYRRAFVATHGINGIHTHSE